MKLESGAYDEDCKDFTLKANQSLIDNVNLDSIPELPEIPELKFADVNEVAGGSGARGEESLEGGGKMGTDPGDHQVRSQQSTASNSGMSPGQEDSRQGVSPGRGLSPGPPSEGSLLGHPSMSEFLDESRKGNEDSYHHDGMGFMQHLQGIV